MRMAISLFTGVSPNTEYIIAELQTLKGYVAVSKEWTFTTGTKGGVEYALEETFVNQEAGDEITLTRYKADIDYLSPFYIATYRLVIVAQLNTME